MRTNVHAHVCLNYFHETGASSHSDSLPLFFTYFKRLKDSELLGDGNNFMPEGLKMN